MPKLTEHVHAQHRSDLTAPRRWGEGLAAPSRSHDGAVAIARQSDPVSRLRRLLLATTASLTEHDEQQRDALAERLFGAARSVMECYCVHIGDRLGLYRALATNGGLTAPELARAAGIHPRYAREWLEQQAVSGIVELDDIDAAPDERRFTLPPGHAETLVDRDSIAYSAPLARLGAAVSRPLPQLMDAFRNGGGVPWTAYGADGREAQADLNRVEFIHHPEGSGSRRCPTCTSGCTPRARGSPT